jgi:hypothetical protein
LPAEETPIPSPTEAVPSVSPEIVVTSPIAEDTPEPLAVSRTNNGVSPAGWAWFVAGMLVGSVAGIVSGGLIRKRRKKQAIFG